MSKTRNVERDLLQYFASAGAPVGRVFSIRDFNAQVMMNAYTAADRASLHLALLALAEDDIILAVSPTGYILTPKGLLLVAQVGEAKRAAAFGERPSLVTRE